MGLTAKLDGKTNLLESISSRTTTYKCYHIYCWGWHCRIVSCYPSCVVQMTDLTSRGAVQYRSPQCGSRRLHTDQPVPKRHGLWNVSCAAVVDQGTGAQMVTGRAAIVIVPQYAAHWIDLSCISRAARINPTLQFIITIFQLVQYNTNTIFIQSHIPAHQTLLILSQPGPSNVIPSWRVKTQPAFFCVIP
jgi:hypothetical protein